MSVYYNESSRTLTIQKGIDINTDYISVKLEKFTSGVLNVKVKDIKPESVNAIVKRALARLNVTEYTLNYIEER